MNPTTEKIRKAAILVATLDAAAADALLERMPSEVAARVRNTVMQLREVPEDEREEVIQQFLRNGDAGSAEIGDADSGVELDESLRWKIEHPESLPRTERSSRPAFHFLREASPESVARHLRDENPQIAAIVLAHMTPASAAEVVAHLPAWQQAGLLRRVAELDAADVEVLREVERHLESLLADEIRLTRSRAAGLSAVASILNAAGERRRNMASNLARHDRQLAVMLQHAPDASHTIADRTAPPRPRAATDPASTDTASTDLASTDLATRSNARDVASQRPATEETPKAASAKPAASALPTDPIAFVDFARLDDYALARIFRDADPRVALLALAGANRDLLNRLLRQMPSSSARSLRRRLRELGPLRLADIEQAQRELGELAGTLADEGQIQRPSRKRFAMAA